MPNQHTSLSVSNPIQHSVMELLDTWEDDHETAGEWHHTWEIDLARNEEFGWAKESSPSTFQQREGGEAISPESVYAMILAVNSTLAQSIFSDVLGFLSRQHASLRQHVSHLEGTLNERVLHLEETIAQLQEAISELTNSITSTAQSPLICEEDLKKARDKAVSIANEFGWPVVTWRIYPGENLIEIVVAESDADEVATSMGDLIERLVQELTDDVIAHLIVNIAIDEAQSN